MVADNAYTVEQCFGNFPVELVILGKKHFNAVELVFTFFGTRKGLLRSGVGELFKPVEQRRFEQRLIEESADTRGFRVLLDFAPIVRGNKQYGDFLVKAVSYLLRGLYAVYAGQLPVEQNYVVASARVVRLDGFFYRGFSVERPFSVDAYVFKRRNRGFAQRLVVVDDKHFPRGKKHVFLLDFGDFEVERDVEFGALARFALKVDSAVHGVDNILGYRHAEPRALGLVNSAFVLAGERFEYLFLEFGGHAYAVVLDANMRANVSVAYGRGFLIEINADCAFVLRELDCVGEKVQKHLIEPYAVAVDVFV